MQVSKLNNFLLKWKPTLKLIFVLSAFMLFDYFDNILILHTTAAIGVFVLIYEFSKMNKGERENRFRVLMVNLALVIFVLLIGHFSEKL